MRKGRPCLRQQLPPCRKVPSSRTCFDQLGLTVNERRIATKALVSMASREGIECLTAEVIDDRALLQEASEITFSDEDMEVGYSDH